MSLLNVISMGFGPVIIGQITECGAAPLDRLAHARNFARRKAVDDADFVVFGPWRETG